MLRAALLAGSAISALTFGVSAAEAQSATPAAGPKPAVSQVNGKVAAFGGSIDGFTGYGVNGALSVPLGPKFGAQIDAMLGLANGDQFWGVGGHLFWRDPAQALIGVYGSIVDWYPTGFRVNKIGGEIEWYHGPLTLEGFVAAQSGDFSGIAGGGTVVFYIHDNLRLDGGYRYLQGVGAIGSAGIEWQHEKSGLALFANGNWGSNGFSTVLGGVRFYAGPPKTLIQRQREDDPPVPQPDDLAAWEVMRCW